MLWIGYQSSIHIWKTVSTVKIKIKKIATYGLISYTEKKMTICAPDQHVSVWNRNLKIMPHTSLWLMTHWMSQAGSSLLMALLNAVSTCAFNILILMCFWDLKDLTAWGNCASICSPDNQKECSAKRAITNRIVRYWLQSNWFIIPAVAWNLESPCIYNQ